MPCKNELYYETKDIYRTYFEFGRKLVEKDRTII